ncbi:MAG: ferredoxin-type protein NapG [Cocleimonas sp.]
MAKSKTSRRDFLAKMARNATLAAAGGSLWAHLLQQQAHANSLVIRPPGALDDDDFNTACIKCGQCVTDCPYDTLKLATIEENIPIGTPYFTPRDVPCYMCEDIPCTRACPTGALSPTLTKIEDARMGLAVIDMENCISYLGLRCEICHRVCPVQNKAITIEHHPRKTSKHSMFIPIVHSSDCTGCGVCVEACPTDEEAIKIVRADMVQGKIGEHYRLGWENQGKITQDFKAPKRKQKKADQPAGGLDYLNQGDFE